VQGLDQAWRSARRWLLPGVLMVSGAAAMAAGSGAGAEQPAAVPESTAAGPVPARQGSVAGTEPDSAAGGEASAGMPAHVRTIRLRHSAEGLRKTYLDRLGRRKDGMHLPRIIVFNGEGRLLGGQGGFRTGDMRHLRRLVHEDKPFPRAADLEDTLAELETPAGAPVAPAYIPEADAVLVVYRSADCQRCDRLDAELSVVVARLHRHSFVWLEVDSDPARVEAALDPASAH
jgi:hypothetical protein